MIAGKMTLRLSLFYIIIALLFIGFSRLAFVETKRATCLNLQ